MEIEVLPIGWPCFPECVCVCETALLNFQLKQRRLQRQPVIDKQRWKHKKKKRAEHNLNYEELVWWYRAAIGLTIQYNSATCVSARLPRSAIGQQLHTIWFMCVWNACCIGRRRCFAPRSKQPIINYSRCHKSKALSMNKDKICYKFSNYVSLPHRNGYRRQWNGNKKKIEGQRKQISFGPLSTGRINNGISMKGQQKCKRRERIGENEPKKKERKKNRSSKGPIRTVCSETTPFPPTLDRSVFGEQTAHLTHWKQRFASL